jgi:hypothetical protein
MIVEQTFENRYLLVMYNLCMSTTASVARSACMRIDKYSGVPHAL